MKTINVVESNPDIQRLMEIILVEEGYQLTEGKPDLRITNNWHLVERSRAEGIRVIYTSAWRKDADLPKPFLIETLLKMVKDAVS